MNRLVRFLGDHPVLSTVIVMDCSTRVTALVVLLKYADAHPPKMAHPSVNVPPVMVMKMFPVT